MVQRAVGVFTFLLCCWSAMAQANSAAIGRPRLVALNVPALQASIDWYRGNLGFAVKEQKDLPQYGLRIAMLELNGFWLELVEKKQSFSTEFVRKRIPEITDWDDVQGIKKLAFVVSDAPALAQRLKARGVKFQLELRGKPEDPVFGRSFIVLDNAGNWIQFCEIRR